MRLYASRPRPATQPRLNRTHANQRRFAKPVDPCENGIMRKFTIIAANSLVSGMMLIGNAQAQQTPATSTPAATTPAAPAAKTPQTATTAKAPVKNPATAEKYRA